ncbi:MAG: hypothetical protein HFH94_08770 [Lachnospiraceae bacterium]|nr:TerB N-terminal domain-containing protein [uncultured Acetatifactor sp.]MCI9219813.1 hypothetical protein [Lachnospiraceae bacterium]
MGKYDKEYEAFRLFEQIQEQTVREEPSMEESNVAQKQTEETPYYEIEYDSCPMPGVGKFVLKSAKIQPPPREADPVRERFNQMRDIARESRCLTFSNSKFYDKRIQQENARLLYRQGMFMKDFEDSCDRNLPYSAYFPTYQMMGYGQLRTYFTWRTKVRQGDILQTSLSYVFLYLYELLNNIGVESPQEGMERLMLLWDAYRVYDESIDKYVLRWLKDYHIYYELPWSFRDFVQRHNLSPHYPKLFAPEDDFDLYCAISKYDIRKSVFFTEERAELIRDCFRFVMGRLCQAFAQSHVELEDYVFHPKKNMSVWMPFQGALFYPALRQPDRRVVLSEREIYLCIDNRWTFSTTITTESGKQLIGYTMKQMEAVLRRLTKYRHKLSANIGTLSPMLVQELQKDGISPEAVITQATEAFYKEATKTVVKVDSAMLEKIRREALATQERLIVSEENLSGALDSSGALEDSGTEERPPDGSLSDKAAGQNGLQAVMPGSKTALQMPLQSIGTGSPAVQEEADITDLYTSPRGSADDSRASLRPIPQSLPQAKTPDWQISSPAREHADEWADLWENLTEIQQGALALAISGGADIKKFADAHSVMLEVLMDGINEKSMDFVGDSILGDDFEIYEDYREQVKGMVESL